MADPYTLGLTASQINDTLIAAQNSDNAPAAGQSNLVNSNRVYEAIQTEAAVVTALDARVGTLETDVIALQSPSVKQAVFSFPDTTFGYSRSLTGWTLLSDNTGGVTYSTNGTFTLGSGLWVGFFSSLATEINDNDGDKFTFSLRKNGSNIWSRSLDGASPTNPLIVQRSLAGSNPYDFYMYENPTNTSTSLENTVFVLTKYV